MRRLFRADTVHDVVCMCIVAETLPAGDDILALCADKAYGDLGEYLACMRATAGVHSWKAIIDVSGLPLNRHWIQPGTRGSPRQRAVAMVETVRRLRSVIAEAFAPGSEGRPPAGDREQGVDELYLTCLDHDDVRALAKVLPAARKICCPHGFDSLHEAEIRYYSPFCASEKGGKSWYEAAADGLKGLVWGEDAVPLRKLSVDAAYSFNLPAPWARAQISLKHLLNRDTVLRVFRRLPAEVQAYYTGLAAACAERTAILLLSPEWSEIGYSYDRELAGYVELVKHMRDEAGARCVVVKPHPRSSHDHLRSTVAHIESKATGVKLLLVEKHTPYPVEVVLAPFPISCCGGIGSSAIRPLRRLYGITAFCPESLMLELWAYRPLWREAARSWILDNRGEYVPVG